MGLLFRLLLGLVFIILMWKSPGLPTVGPMPEVVVRACPPEYEYGSIPEVVVVAIGPTGELPEVVVRAKAPRLVSDATQGLFRSN